MNENKEQAEAILSEVLYITLATVSPDGFPWNAPVYAAFDEAYRFFWVSSKAAHHSQNIRANNRVAIVVYDSTVPPGTGKGVYIQARAYELTDEHECAHALAALQRRGWEHPPSVNTVLGASLRGVYQAVPEQVWINGEDEHGLDARVAVDLLQGHE